MRNLLLAGIALSASVLALPALATPLGGKSIGNIAVNGGVYTVNFFDSSLSTVPAPQNTFTTFATANSAIAAIVASPAYTVLIGSATNYKGLIVPYTISFGPEPLQYHGAVGSSNSNADLTLYYNSNPDINLTGDYSRVGYAIAQFVPASVPEPASIAVVAFGLFGLGWARRRFSV